MTPQTADQHCVCRADEHPQCCNNGKIYNPGAGWMACPLCDKARARAAGAIAEIA